MKRIARKSDGRRIYTAEFKREQIARVLRGDVTIAELGRKLGIARGLLQRWKRLEVLGVSIGAAGSDGAWRSRSARASEQQIGELQRLVGKQAVELENLRAERDALKARRRS